MAKNRDKIVHAVANWVINTFASAEYKENLEYTYLLGMRELENRYEAKKTRAMLDGESR